jgi:hypothetical protein
MVVHITRYCIMLLLLLPVLPVLTVCCIGRTSRGLWDQLSVDSDHLYNSPYSNGNSYMRSNMKKRILSENTVDKMKALEGDRGFWGMILKMGMKKTKKKKIIKQSRKTFPRHSKHSKQMLSKMKKIKLKKRENELPQVPR